MEDDKFIEELKQAEKLMMNVALKLTAEKDAAHELCQETIVKAYIKRHTYIKDSNFKLWILTILRNNFINKSECNTLHSNYTNEVNHNNSLHLKPDYIDNFIDSTNIKFAIKLLPMIYYTPLNMYISGYKFYEISEELQIPLHTVKNRIYAAREKLRIIMEDYLR